MNVIWKDLSPYSTCSIRFAFVARQAVEQTHSKSARNQPANRASGNWAVTITVFVEILPRTGAGALMRTDPFVFSCTIYKSFTYLLNCLTSLLVYFC